jgi:hypothetical protein
MGMQNILSETRPKKNYSRINDWLKRNDWLTDETFVAGSSGAGF